MSGLDAFLDSIRRKELTSVMKLWKTEYADIKNYIGWTPLHYACWYTDDVDIVQFLLKRGCNANEASYNKETPINIATRFNRTNVVKHLLASGSKLDVLDNSGMTPLDWAISKNDETSTILKSAQSYQRKNISKKHDNQPRTRTISKSNDNIACFLELIKYDNLSRVINLNTGETLLDLSLAKNNERILNAIRQKTIDDKEISDFLAIICRKENIQSYSMLHECLLYRCIEHNNQMGFTRLCTPDITNRSTLFMGSAVLETAVLFERIAFVKIILPMLLDLHESWARAKDVVGKCSGQVVSSLISQRLEYISRKRKNGYNRLHLAVFDNNVEIIDFIMNNRLINHDDGDKTVGTPISLAYLLNHVDCARAILKYPINVSTVDQLRQTPLHVAISNRVEDDCDQLVDNMIDIDIRDYMGFTVLDRAILRNCEKVCEQIMKRRTTHNVYVNIDHKMLEIYPDLSFILSQKPFVPLTVQETIYTLCAKVNCTLYSHLITTIDDKTVNLTDDDGNTVLHVCSVSRQSDVCFQLLSKGANVDRTNVSGCTPLMMLLQISSGSDKIETDLLETVRILINGGASINVGDKDGYLLLEKATQFHSEELLLTLIQKQEPIELVSEHIWSTWIEYNFFAMLHQVIPLINKSLLSKWITCDLVYLTLTRPDIYLPAALYNSANEIIQTTVEQDILYKAAECDNEPIFQTIITKNLDQSLRIINDEPLLIRLIVKKWKKFCEIVLHSPNAVFLSGVANKVNKLPIHVCVAQEYWEVMAPLIISTNCLDAEDDEGQTALSLLFEKLSNVFEETQISQLFEYSIMMINKSADIYKVNKFNKKAIHYCTNLEIRSRIETCYRLKQRSNPRGMGKDAARSGENTESWNQVCQICLIYPKNCAINCGHSFCISCANKVTVCYKCQTEITNRLKLFL